MQQSIELFEWSMTAYLNILFSFALLSVNCFIYFTRLLSIIRYSETQRNMQQSIELFEWSMTAYLNILFSFAINCFNTRVELYAADRALRMEQACLFEYFIFLRQLNIFLSIIRYSETQRNMQQSIELFEWSMTAYLNILFSFATLSVNCYSQLTVLSISLVELLFKHHPILWNTAKYAAIDRALRMKHDCLFKYFIFLRATLS